MTYPIVVLPQRSKADVGANSHIAKKGHPGILTEPGELIDDILHGNNKENQHKIQLASCYSKSSWTGGFCSSSSISGASIDSPAGTCPSAVNMACPQCHVCLNINLCIVISSQTGMARTSVKATFVSWWSGATPERTSPKGVGSLSMMSTCTCSPNFFSSCTGA